MAGAGIKKFVTGEIFSAPAVNTYLMDQTVAVFANAAERDAAFGDPTEPELSEGRICYLKSTKKIQFFDGNVWIDSAQFTVGDGTIVTSKLDETLGSEAVTTAKIRNGAVTNEKLSSTAGLEAVNTAQIRSGAVTTAKLASNLTLSGTTTIAGTGKVQQLIEKSLFLTTLTGAQTVNVSNGTIVYYSSECTGNFQLKLSDSSPSSLNSIMSNHDVVTFVVFTTQGATAYRLTSITIDDLTSGVNVFWFGGSPYPSGNASSVDAYTITVVKTNNNAFNVFASQSSFKA